MSSTALSPFSSTTTIPSILSVPISKKLTKTNYPLWRAQVFLAIRAAQLKDFLTGDDVAPAKTVVVSNTDKSSTMMTNLSQDQAVLGYLMLSLTREMLLHVSRCSTMVHDLYSSQTGARSINTRIALATTRKN
jgi:hypothetical protein